MGGASLEFLGFAVIVAVAYQLFRSAQWHNWILLLASFCLLSTFTHDYHALLPFVVFLAFGYCGLQIVRRRRSALAAFVIGTVLLFMYLKKYSLIPMEAFLPFPVLTVGLSYILFRVLHLMIDTDSGAIQGMVGPLEYLVYTLNFTTLVSGPIQRYQDFKKTMEEAATKRPGLRSIGEAVERIIVGLFKTNALALVLSDVQNSAIAELSRGGARHFAMGVISFTAYPLFLYCNFSGYIDMVIGIGRLLGITLPENFQRPFSSDSFSEFWNRWHITLSAWLRTYVYTPLLISLMRKYPMEKLEPVWAVSAFFVTFFLVGVWHGQTDAFLFFGFLQGLGVSMNKLYQILMMKGMGRKAFRSLSSSHPYVIAARGLTFTWFTFTLLWFWSNFNQIGKLFAALGWQQVVLVWLAIWVGASVILATWEFLRAAVLSIQWRGNLVIESRYWRTAWDTALAITSAAVMLLSNQPAPELVYKAF